jgi:hypothetical protein
MLRLRGEPSTGVSIRQVIAAESDPSVHAPHRGERPVHAVSADFLDGQTQLLRDLLGGHNHFAIDNDRLVVAHANTGVTRPAPLTIAIAFG